MQTKEPKKHKEINYPNLADIKILIKKLIQLALLEGKSLTTKELKIENSKKEDLKVMLRSSPDHSNHSEEYFARMDDLVDECYNKSFESLRKFIMEVELPEIEFKKENNGQ